MKKFLQKLPTMIVLIVLSVSMLVLTLVVACRPVKYGDKYETTFKTNISSNGNEYLGEVAIKFSFEKDDVLSIDYRTETSHFVAISFRIIRDGNDFIILGTANNVSVKDQEIAEIEFKHADQSEKANFYATHTYGRVKGYSLRLENNHILHSILSETTEDTDIQETLKLNEELPMWYFNSSYIPRVCVLASIDAILIIFATFSIVLFAKRKKA